MERNVNHDKTIGFYKPFGETLTEADTGSVAFNSPYPTLVWLDMKAYSCRKTNEISFNPSYPTSVGWIWELYMCKRQTMGTGCWL